MSIASVDNFAVIQSFAIWDIKKAYWTRYCIQLDLKITGASPCLDLIDIMNKIQIAALMQTP